MDALHFYHSHNARALMHSMLYSMGLHREGVGKTSRREAELRATCGNASYRV